MSSSHTSSQSHSSSNVSRGLASLWVVVGIVAVIVLLVLAARVIAAATTDTTTEEQTFAPDGVDRIEVDGEAGDIDIVVADVDDITVTTHVTSGRWDRATSDARVVQGTLLTTSECERSLFFSDCQTELEIVLPGDAVGSMEITATAGAIRLDGVSGSVEATTTAGAIELAGFLGETARLETTAGAITVGAESAPDLLEARTTAGEIRIEVPDEVYRISADTTVGDIAVDLREDADADRLISASTTAGDISVSAR